MLPDEDKLKFYLEQIYASNHFKKEEMTEWENKPEAIKNSFDKAMTYFKRLVRDYKVYKQNSNSTAGKHSFESANQATTANRGNKLRQYIAKISKAAVMQEEQATNIHYEMLFSVPIQVVGHAEILLYVDVKRTPS
jgi:uncharacterized protein with ParB-like and HNH nuclease domain